MIYRFSHSGMKEESRLCMLEKEPERAVSENTEKKEAPKEVGKESLNFQEAIKAFQEYQVLKRDPKLSLLAKDIKIAREKGITLSEKEEKEYAEYSSNLARVLEAMSRNLALRANENNRLPDGFNQDQLIDAILTEADAAGMREAREDLIHYAGVQQACLDILKKRLGENFDKQDPGKMLLQTAKVLGVKNIPADVRKRLRSLGLNMQEGTTFGVIQPLIESIGKNASISRGSFLLKASGGLAGVWAVTSAFANVLGPMLGFSFTLMKNLTNPKTAVKEIKAQISESWGNRKKFAGGVMQTALFGALGAVALSDNPIGTMKGVVEGAKEMAGEGYEKVEKKAAKTWERVSENRPSDRIVRAMKESWKGDLFFEQSDGVNTKILEEMYSGSGAEFNLQILNDIRDVDHLKSLEQKTLDTTKLPEELKTAYENGRERIQAAKRFLTLTNEFAEKYGISVQDRKNIKMGGLAKILVDGFNNLQPQDQPFYGKLAEAVRNGYEDTAGSTVQGLWEGSVTTVSNLYSVVWKNIILNKDTKYPGIERGKNIPKANIPKESIEPGVVPSIRQSAGVGLNFPEGIETEEPFKSEAPKAFALLLAHARLIQNPRAFVRMTV